MSSICQIISEADGIHDKYLFTLQQGISEQQLERMATEHVILVAPTPYIGTHPEEKRNSIWTLQKFIAFTKSRA